MFGLLTKSDYVRGYEAAKSQMVNRSAEEVYRDHRYEVKETEYSKGWKAACLEVIEGSKKDMRD